MSVPHSGNPTVGLGRFIKDSRFVVPSHQRDYSWNQEHVSEFVRDIEEAVSSHNSSYFCGLMVFTETAPASYKVLDGQQRLATTLMLFSAVRNWFGGYSKFEKENRLVGDYLGKEEFGSTFEPKLSLTAANNDAFQKYVIGSVPLTEMVKALRAGSINDRSVALVKAAIDVGRHVEGRAEKLGSPESAQEYFTKFLLYITD